MTGYLITLNGYINVILMYDNHWLHILSLKYDMKVMELVHILTRRMLWEPSAEEIIIFGRPHTSHAPELGVALGDPV